MGSNSIKGSRCCREQETSLSLLSTCWFQERIRAWFHNQTKINWGLLSLLVRYYQNLNQTNINTATQALKYKHCHTSTQIQTKKRYHKYYDVNMFEFSAPSFLSHSNLISNVLVCFRWARQASMLLTDTYQMFSISV